MTLAIGYAVKLQLGEGKGLRAHRTEQATWGYIEEVNAWHHAQVGVPLVPREKDLEREIKKVIKGLVKLKPGSTWHRRGLNMQHVLALNEVTRSMEGEVIRVPGNHRCSRPLDSKLIANINSLRTFAWQNLFRLGEATITEARLWNQPLEAGKRPSRASLMALYDTDGVLQGFQLPALGYKCNNMHTDADLTMRIHQGDPLNAARDLQCLLETDNASLDPPGIRQDEATVPLWRFSPREDRAQDAITGTTLTPDFIRQLDRTIISRHAERFRPVTAAEIGGHSYRIGGCSALLAAGAPMLIIQAMGRWSSDCFLLYCRQGQKQKDVWARKMLSVRDPDAVYDCNSDWATGWQFGARL